MVAIEDIRIPSGYYIQISCFGASNHYRPHHHNENWITVYKSLDHGHSFPVEHVMNLGSFKITDTDKLTVHEFYGKLRQGIEHVLAENDPQGHKELSLLTESAARPPSSKFEVIVGRDGVDTDAE
ncbi:MAG: hypothetical protein V1725_04205 [archaeon]